MKFFLKLKKLVLDILFPLACLGCGKEDVWLCDECLEKIPVEEFFYCPVCKQKSLRGEVHAHCQPDFYLDGLLIAGQWENKNLRQLIHRLKYNFVQDLKIPLGKILIKKIQQANHFFTPALNSGYFDGLIPVPLARRRLLWRGFNQAQLLAEQVMPYLETSVWRETIKRIKNTRPQVGQKQRQRQKNINGAFLCDLKFTNSFKDKKILLIDDVYTTGATMLEVAKVLKTAGAKEVWGLVLARG